MPDGVPSAGCALAVMRFEEPPLPVLAYLTFSLPSQLTRPFPSWPRSCSQTEIFLKNPSRFADVARAHVEEHARQDTLASSKKAKAKAAPEGSPATAAGTGDGAGVRHRFCCFFHHRFFFRPPRMEGSLLCVRPASILGHLSRGMYRQVPTNALRFVYQGSRSMNFDASALCVLDFPFSLSFNPFPGFLAERARAGGTLIACVSYVRSRNHVLCPPFVAHVSCACTFSRACSAQAKKGSASPKVAKDAVSIPVSAADERPSSGSSEKKANGGDGNRSSVPAAEAKEATPATAGKIVGGGALGEGAAPGAREKGEKAARGAATPAVDEGRGEDASRAGAGAAAGVSEGQDVEARGLGVWHTSLLGRALICCISR